MMKTQTKILLWRAEWTHRDGYQAPYQLIWAETRKEATKKINSRLSDFPKSWSYKLFKIVLEEEKSS